MSGPQESCKQQYQGEQSWREGAYQNGHAVAHTENMILGWGCMCICTFKSRSGFDIEMDSAFL